MKLELIQALGHAAEGQRVGWVGNRHAEIADDFQYADKASQDAASHICRANGMQEITFPNGGRLVFLTPHRVRGFSLDRAYVPIDATEYTVTEVLPALDTSGGPMVEYR